MMGILGKRQPCDISNVCNEVEETPGHVVMKRRKRAGKAAAAGYGEGVMRKPRGSKSGAGGHLDSSMMSVSSLPPLLPKPDEKSFQQACISGPPPTTAATSALPMYYFGNHHAAIYGGTGSVVVQPAIAAVSTDNSGHSLASSSVMSMEQHRPINYHHHPEAYTQHATFPPEVLQQFSSTEQHQNDCSDANVDDDDDGQEMNNGHAHTQSMILSYPELDYFEQFLGNLGALSANMAAGLINGELTVKDGIIMNPILLNHNQQQQVHNQKQTMEQQLYLPYATHPTRCTLNFHHHNQHQQPQQHQQQLHNHQHQRGSRGRGTSTRNPNKALLDPDTKRAHHIASEHKRRGRIRNELMRLNDLVPELKGNSRNSQSKILSGAADYLEAVIEENRRLKEKLDTAASLEAL